MNKQTFQVLSWIAFVISIVLAVAFVLRLTDFTLPLGLLALVLMLAALFMKGEGK